MTVGVPAVFNFDEYEDGVFQGTASVEETFFGIFPLSVPAGTFNDSALIVINMSKDGVLSETSLWVWANGVGPIFEFNFLPDGTPDDLILLVAIVP